MAIAQITSPSGLGEAPAMGVEDQPELGRTFFVQTLGPPEGAGRSAAKAGVEGATRLLQN